MANQYTAPRVYLICANPACRLVFRVPAHKELTAKFHNRECMRACRPVKHGDARDGRRAPEYDIWRAMLDRCTNPANPFYAGYGGRGIGVCEAWRSYEAFIADVGRRPSIGYQLDRIDNAKGYEPGNVMWSTATQQQRNKRDNVWLTVGGVRRLRIEWAELMGIPHETVRGRLSSGWTPEQALGMEPRPPLGKRRITANGVTLSVAEWSKRNGVRPDVIRSRLRIGWSPERAVSQTPRA